MAEYGNGRLLDHTDPRYLVGQHFRVADYVIPGAPTISGQATFAPTLNSVYAELFCLARPIRFDRIAVEVTAGGTAGSVCRMGLYRVNASLYPTSLIVDGGTVDTTGTGFKSVTIAQTLEPGWYAKCVVAQVAAPTLRYWWTSTHDKPNFGLGTSPADAALNQYNLAGITGALPTPFTAAQTWVGGGNFVLLRVLSLG